MDSSEAVAELKELGFTNIETEEVQDLTSKSDLQDGAIGEISIDGDTDFSAKTSYSKEAPILITYHTIKK